MIPRDGGNKFSGNSIFNFTNTDLASGKVSDDLVARGSAANQNAMKKVYDYGIGVGGPVSRLSKKTVAGFIPYVIETASAISARLGHRGRSVA